MRRRNGSSTRPRRNPSVSWRAATRIAQRPPATLCGSACGDAMGASALIDTGAILALLDRTDRWHRTCVDAFQQIRLPLVTSEAVLTELFHLVGDSRKEMESAWKFVRTGACGDRIFGTAANPCIDVALLGPAHGFRRRNARASRKTGVSVDYLHSRSRGFRDLPNRRPQAFPSASGNVNGLKSLARYRSSKSPGT